MEIRSTRLRFVSAKDPVDLSTFISALPFKVEIKGGPTVRDDRWYLFFVIPDNVLEFNNVSI